MVNEKLGRGINTAFDIKLTKIFFVVFALVHECDCYERACALAASL